MEDKKTLIIFLDDDDTKKKINVIIKEKSLNYVSFEYNKKIITLPWTKIIKIKEDVGCGN